MSGHLKYTGVDERVDPRQVVVNSAVLVQQLFKLIETCQQTQSLLSTASSQTHRDLSTNTKFTVNSSFSNSWRPANKHKVYCLQQLLKLMETCQQTQSLLSTASSQTHRDLPTNTKFTVNSSFSNSWRPANKHKVYCLQQLLKLMETCQQTQSLLSTASSQTHRDLSTNTKFTVNSIFSNSWRPVNKHKVYCLQHLLKLMETCQQTQSLLSTAASQTHRDLSTNTKFTFYSIFSNS